MSSSVSPISACADAEARVFVLLNGLELHIYNRSQLYAHLEQLFGLEPTVLPSSHEQLKPEEPNNAVEDHPWRDLVPVVKVLVTSLHFLVQGKQYCGLCNRLICKAWPASSS